MQLDFENEKKKGIFRVLLPNKHVWHLLSILVCLSILVGCDSDSTSKADGGSSPKPAASGSEKKLSAEDVLRQAADFLQSQKSFRAQKTMHIKVEGPEIQNEESVLYSIGVSRPNRMYLKIGGDVSGVEVVSDGRQLSTYWPMVQKYMFEAAPAKLDGILSSDYARQVVTNQGGPFIELHFKDDIYKALLDGIEGSEYLGVEQLNGIDCHHCKFEHPVMDWEIWVDAGPKPLVHQIVPDLAKRLLADPRTAQELADAKIEMSIIWTDWAFGVEFEDVDFQFVPKKDAQQVDSIFDFLQQGAMGLVGRPVPGFSGKLLEGEPISMEQHQGEHVVILDFWTTWCYACVDAMPILSEIAETYKDQGVVVYSVNMGEQPDTVREFLKENDLDAQVVMDSEDVISYLYLVDSIPQTVIVGKDGRVQSVHVGVDPDFEKQLIEEIEAILNGKDLTMPQVEESGTIESGTIESGTIESGTIEK